MYNRYRGNSGFVEHVDDSPPSPPSEAFAPPQQEFAPPPPPPPPQRNPAPPPPPPPPEGGGGWMGRLLDRFSPNRLETEDLMLIAVFYLLYRETGDTDFLFLMAGVVLF